MDPPQPRRARLLSLALKAAGILPFLTVVALSPAYAQVPRGVFSLYEEGGTANQSVLDNPDVTGITVRQAWADLEPNENEFDFCYLDSEIARAAAAGKQVLLRINTQAGKPAWVTQDIQAAGGTFVTFEDIGLTIPVFWDYTYLTLKKAMITALGEHFAGNPTVTIVSVSFANAISEDWDVPHTPSEVSQDWPSVAYTTDKLTAAGMDLIDTTMQAFPTQYVTLAIQGDGPTLDRGSCDTLVVTCAAATAIANANLTWPGRLIVQINSLSTCNPTAPGLPDTAWNLLFNSQPNVAAQMVDNVYGETTYRANCGTPADYATILTNCVNQGASYGVNYIEIYQTDVRHLPDVITYAHNLLDPAPSQTPTPTPTPTPAATFTPCATATATYTPTPSATFTPTPTATFTPTPTATATYTPTPTATFTPTPTATFTPTPTATFTPTPTATATYTPTPTATFTPTPTPTLTPTVHVTVGTTPAGLTFTVDGTTYSSIQTFSWASGSNHTIATTSPQSGGTGVQYLWTRWSDNGAISHTVSPTTNTTYNATFTTQYFLTMTAGSGGTVTPASGWQNAGKNITIRARANRGFHFFNWTGSGTGSFTGTNNPASITMGGAITETATFTQN